MVFVIRGVTSIIEDDEPIFTDIRKGNASGRTKHGPVPPVGAQWRVGRAVPNA